MILPFFNLKSKEKTEWRWYTYTIMQSEERRNELASQSSKLRKKTWRNI